MNITINEITRHFAGGTDEIKVVATAGREFAAFAQFTVVETVKARAPIPSNIEDLAKKRIRSLIDGN